MDIWILWEKWWNKLCGNNNKKECMSCKTIQRTVQYTVQYTYILSIFDNDVTVEHEHAVATTNLGCFSKIIRFIRWWNWNVPGKENGKNEEKVYMYVVNFSALSTNKVYKRNVKWFWHWWQNSIYPYKVLKPYFTY